MGKESGPFPPSFPFTYLEPGSQRLFQMNKSGMCSDPSMHCSCSGNRTGAKRAGCVPHSRQVRAPCPSPPFPREDNCFSSPLIKIRGIDNGGWYLRVREAWAAPAKQIMGCPISKLFLKMKDFQRLLWYGMIMCTCVGMHALFRGER